MNKLSLSQKQIILGGILGDSYFNYNKNFIRFSHSKKQYEYLLWKRSFFDASDIRKINKREYKEGYIGYNFDFVNKSSKHQELFNFINKNLYTNNRKKISLKYLHELNELGLAIWWMDDGCLSVHKGNRYGKLCTHCFNYEENILIQQYFKNKWGISVDIKIEKNKYYFIRFNVAALKKLISLIYKYVAELPSMIYKIDLNYSKEGSIGDFKEVYFYIKNKKLFTNDTLTTAG